MGLCFLCLNVFVGPKFYNSIQVESVKVVFVDTSKCMEQYEIILQFLQVWEYVLVGSLLQNSSCMFKCII